MNEVFSHPCGTLELLPIAAAPTSGERIPKESEMTTATRADVVRLVARYVQIEYFGIRSAAGRIAIDDSRLTKRRAAGKIDLESASKAEVLDAIRNADIRRAVYAPVTRPVILGERGDPLNFVMPVRSVAQIVRVKSHSSATLAATDRPPQLWKSTIANKLAKLSKEEQLSLIEAENLRLALRIIANQLQAVRSEIERLKSGKAKNLRRHAEQRRAELRSLEQLRTERLDGIVRGETYRAALDNLLRVCTETEEIEQICFGF